LIIAENWEGLHRSLKLGGWALLQLAFLLFAYQLSRVWPDRPALAEAMSFVAGGWMLGGIALVSQIYQLDSRPPNGIWLWLVLVLPGAWLLERRAVTAVIIIALVCGFALEVGQIDSIFRADRVDGPWIWIGVPLLAAGLASYLMLIRLFQHGAMGRVMRAQTPLSHEPSALSGAVRHRRSVCGVPRCVPLAGRLRLPQVRSRARLRLGRLRSVAVCRLPLPGLADGRDSPSQLEDAAHDVVLGRLLDDDGQAWSLGPAPAAPARDRPLRNRMDDSPQASSSDGERGSGASSRQG